MKINIFSLLVKAFLLLFITTNTSISSTSNSLPISTSAVIEKYNAIAEAPKEIPFKAFDLAFRAYLSNNLQNNDVLTIIDYSKPSNQERFYVIDIRQNKLLFKTHTAHGKNTGNLYATKFSNTPESLQSSLGFFKTGETYIGKHGYSLRLLGTEKGINDKAFDRAIVIHPADYLTKEFINAEGRAGRSWGCPALPPNLSKEIINTIKNGSALFIYANDPAYFANTKFIESI